MLRGLLFANFKLVYRLSQWMQHRFTTNGTLILLVMLIAGIFGFNTRSTLSFQIFSVTLVLLLVAMSHALFFRGRFSLERTLPDYGTVDSPVYYSCVIKNQSSRAKKGMVLIDSLYADFPTLGVFKNAQDPQDKNRNRIDRFIGYPRLINVMQKLRGGSIEPATVDYIAKESAAKTTLSLTPLRRGYIYFNKVKLAKADPFGLFQAHKDFATKDKLLILPKLYNAPKLNLHGKRTYQHGGVNNATSVGDSQEFISLRDYRPGDPLKSIHWRSFAKTNKPIVKEYQDEFFIRNALILDTYLDANSLTSFEDAVSVAASFLTSQQERDALLDLMFIGNNAYRFTTGRGLTGSAGILEILACIEPTYQSNIFDLETLINAHLHECSTLICILLSLDEARKQLIQNISKSNMPIKVLLIANETVEIDLENTTSTELHIIRHKHIQSDLDKLI